MTKASRAGPVFWKWCCQSPVRYTTFFFHLEKSFAQLKWLRHFWSIHLSVYIDLMFAFSVPSMWTRKKLRYALEKFQSACTYLVCRTNKTYMPAFFFSLFFHIMHYSLIIYRKTKTKLSTLKLSTRHFDKARFHFSLSWFSF